MSVIIDQFEVILDSQEDKEKKSSASEDGSAGKQAGLKPRDVASIFAQLQNRRERVRAH